MVDMKVTKVMQGWYRIFDDNGKEVGDFNNFYGFWSGEVFIDGEYQKAKIVSETKKQFEKEFAKKYSHLFNV